MADDLLIDNSPQARITTGLVHWRHALGRDAHCLVRLVQPTSPGRSSVILSELASNPDAYGLISDFPAAATAALALLLPHAALDPQTIRWFAHHGEFSTYDPTGATTLIEVTLTYTGDRYHGDLRGQQLLPPEQTAELFESWQLEPVPTATARLGHTG
ncbi:hypothetical protein [Streptomyces griseocarneus]|uniref:hypothetical protein n=1 Tax=Streptomyces griseocarneus TaxID=51201 RepID=UPI00167D2211|nr:hypothetical protein [Streptomyces griseocarneus]MBZ6476242.1 hypothetical protein [Streptomyces griseocarneus]GHG63149.1 hypothetical protein GCM10018779_32460 [Streptomyces griseocarneus]